MIEANTEMLMTLYRGLSNVESSCLTSRDKLIAHTTLNNKYPAPRLLVIKDINPITITNITYIRAILLSESSSIRYARLMAMFTEKRIVGINTTIASAILPKGISSNKASGGITRHTLLRVRSKKLTHKAIVSSAIIQAALKRIGVTDATSCTITKYRLSWHNVFSMKILNI